MANERAMAARFVQEVLAACDAQGFAAVTFFSILDHVSKDGTLELMRELSQQEPRLKIVWAPENRSVTDAYVRGYREALKAGCDWILEIDAGYSHQPSDIPQFFEKMDEGYECVFGSRFCTGGTMSESPLKRRVVSRGGTWLANLLLGTKLKDMTSGFELFSREALEDVLRRGIRSRGPFFQTEIKTHCHDFRFAEVPIQYRAPSHNLNRVAVKDALANLWRLYRTRKSSASPSAHQPGLHHES